MSRAAPRPSSERIVGIRGRRRPRTGGIAATALTGSVVWHALVLLIAGSVYQLSPESPPRPAERPASEVSYVLLPPLAAPPAPPEDDAAMRDATKPLRFPDTPPSGRTSLPSSPDTATAATPGASALGVTPGSPAAATAASLLRPGFSDPRLFAEGGGLTPEAPGKLSDRFEESLGAAMTLAEDSLSAERRRERGSNQVRVLGRNITLFGDSMNAHWRGLIVGNQRMTMPVDGREWEDLQMKKQRDDFVRDSILRARAAATRARVDAERRKSRD